MTVYVRPELVVRSRSTTCRQARHYPGGLALRFARVKRYRDDKTALDGDTIETVRAIYEGQRWRAGVSSVAGPGAAQVRRAPEI
jgi:hypothetical protein